MTEKIAENLIYIIAGGVCTSLFGFLFALGQDYIKSRAEKRKENQIKEEKLLARISTLYSIFDNYYLLASDQTPRRFICPECAKRGKIIYLHYSAALYSTRYYSAELFKNPLARTLEPKGEKLFCNLCEYSHIINNDPYCIEKPTYKELCEYANM